MEKNCIHCKFFLDDQNDDGLGTCRKYAPHPIISNDENTYFYAWWPTVAIEDWCGEFEPEPEKPMEEPPF